MTNIQYKVDDMTSAPMDVKQWVDTEVSDGFYPGTNNLRNVAVNLNTLGFVCKIKTLDTMTHS